MNQIYEQHLRSEANKKLNSDIISQQRKLLSDFADIGTRTVTNL